MDFLELADQVQRTRPQGQGTSTEGSDLRSMGSLVDGLGADEDEQRASLIALVSLGDDDGPNFGKDSDEDDGDEKKPLPERILKWFLKKLVGKVARTGAEVVIESIWSAVRWFTEEVLIGGLRMAGEFLLRSVLLEAGGFLISNPIGWGILGAAGVGAVCYWIYKRFFNDSEPTPADAKQMMADYKLPEAVPEYQEYQAKKEYFYAPDNVPQTSEQQTTTPALPSTEGVRTTPSVQPSHTRTVQPPPEQPARAPVAAQAPRRPEPSPVIPTPATGDSLENYVRPIIARHEGRKNRPYKDSKGLWTIGIGHLIGDGLSLPAAWDRTLTDAEVDALFTTDYEKHLAIARRMPNFDRFNIQGQAALVDMAFNLGQFWTPHGSSRGWPSWTAKMQAFDVQGVVDNLTQNTVWRSQVHGRADEDIALLATNVTADTGTRYASQGQPAGPTSTGSARGVQQPLQVANSEIIRGPNGQPMRIN